MQIFKCGICVLADGCISMSYLNILVSLCVCVNLQSHSCEQAWCCIKFCSSVYLDEQYSFSLLMAMFTQKCHMCVVSAVLVNRRLCCLSRSTFSDIMFLIAWVVSHPENTLKILSYSSFIFHKSVSLSFCLSLLGSCLLRPHAA